MSTSVATPDVKSYKNPLIYLASFAAAFIITAVVLYWGVPKFITKKDANGNDKKDMMKLSIYSFAGGLVGLAFGMFFNTVFK